MLTGMVRLPTVVVLLIACLSAACARSPKASPMNTTPPRDPARLTATLGQPMGHEPEPQTVAAAVADPEALSNIERAARSGLSDIDQAALGSLLARMYATSPSEEIVEVARRLVEHSPRHHLKTLAQIAWTMPLDRAERELLRLAFYPIPDTEPPRGIYRGGRAFAAQYLVTKLAFDARVTPRPIPSPEAGPVSWKVDESDPWCRVQQWGLIAAYGVGDSAQAKARFEAAVNSEEARSNDHDWADCATLADRLGIVIPPP